jgi:hypothetical protein
MKNAQLETIPLRLLGAPDTQHDFLVPNPRPDLSELVAAPAPRACRVAVDPDSMFWHPGDAA